MNILRLRLVDEVYISKPGVFSFSLTASVYNFSIWFNGRRLLVPLEGLVIAVQDEYDKLKASIYSYTERLDIDVDDVLKQLNHVLGIDEDLTEFYAIASRDPLLSQSIGILHGMHMRASLPWIASVVGVCQQNASFKQGWRMFYNFVKLLGGRAVVENDETLLPPKPSDISSSSVTLLAEAGLGYRAKTVIRLAELFEKSSHLNRWDVSPSELEEKLLEVKGVGSYTARLALALSLRDYSKPPIDRWIREIAAEVYGVERGGVEKTFLGLWGRWSGLAVLYTTVALDAEPLSRALDRVRKKMLRPDPSRFSPLTMWRYL